MGASERFEDAGRGTAEVPCSAAALRTAMRGHAPPCDPSLGQKSCAWPVPCRSSCITLARLPGGTCPLLDQLERAYVLDFGFNGSKIFTAISWRAIAVQSIRTLINARPGVGAVWISVHNSHYKHGRKREGRRPPELCHISPHIRRTLRSRENRR